MRHRDKLYFDAFFLAEFYLWSALRGFPLVGNCPLTGRPYGGHDQVAREQGRICNKALARYWLQRARRIRKGGAA